MSEHRIVYNNGDRFLSAMDFLRYSVFGVSENDLLCRDSDEDLMDFILNTVIRRAFRDAASHVLKKGEKNGDEEWDAKKTQAQNTIKEYIKSLSSEPKAFQKKEEELSDIDWTLRDEMDVYDVWHYKLTKELQSVFMGKNKNAGSFCVGIAQKWINMTMKYLEVFCRSLQASEECHVKNGRNLHELFPDELRKLLDMHRPYFHIPLDGYIRNALKKLSDCVINDEDAENQKSDENRVAKGLGTGKAINHLPKTWSTIKYYNEYLKLQIEVRKASAFYDDTANSPYSFTPFDWEGMAWIDEARKKRDSDKSKDRKSRRDSNSKKGNH